jgi:hypothetical protein
VKPTEFGIVAESFEEKQGDSIQRATRIIAETTSLFAFASPAQRSGTMRALLRAARRFIITDSFFHRCID